MANDLNLIFDGILLQDAYEDLDGYWGLYESVSDAFSKIRSSLRKAGKRFDV